MCAQKQLCHTNGRMLSIAVHLCESCTNMHLITDHCLYVSPHIILSVETAKKLWINLSGRIATTLCRVSTDRLIAQLL